MYKYSPDTLNIPDSGQFGVAFKFGNYTASGNGKWEYIIAYSTENPAKTCINRKINSGQWTGWVSYATNQNINALFNGIQFRNCDSATDIDALYNSLPNNSMCIANVRTANDSISQVKGFPVGAYGYGALLIVKDSDVRPYTSMAIYIPHTSLSGFKKVYMRTYGSDSKWLEFSGIMVDSYE